jgi:hypothetical protein
MKGHINASRRRFSLTARTRHSELTPCSQVSTVGWNLRTSCIPSFNFAARTPMIPMVDVSHHLFDCESEYYRLIYISSRNSIYYCSSDTKFYCLVFMCLRRSLLSVVPSCVPIGAPSSMPSAIGDIGHFLTGPQFV